MALRLKPGYEIKEYSQESDFCDDEWEYDYKVLHNGEEVARAEIAFGFAELIVVLPDGQWLTECAQGVWIDDYQEALHKMFVDAGLDSPWESDE